MSEWQPIETAPKDGTEILVWADGMYLVLAWSKLNKAHGPDGRCWNDGHYDYDYFHWMPLPDPPKEPDYPAENNLSFEL